MTLNIKKLYFPTEHCFIKLRILPNFAELKSWRLAVRALFFIIFAALFGIVYRSESAAKRAEAKQDYHEVRLNQTETTVQKTVQEFDKMTMKLMDLNSKAQLVLKGLGATTDNLENGINFFHTQ